MAQIIDPTFDRDHSRLNEDDTDLDSETDHPQQTKTKTKTNDSHQTKTDNTRSNKTDDTRNTNTGIIKAPATLRCKYYKATFEWPIGLSREELADISDPMEEMFEESGDYGISTSFLDEDIREYSMLLEPKCGQDLGTARKDWLDVIKHFPRVESVACNPFYGIDPATQFESKSARLDTYQ